jgi:hypothetical protein
MPSPSDFGETRVKTEMDVGGGVLSTAFQQIKQQDEDSPEWSSALQGN